MKNAAYIRALLALLGTALVCEASAQFSGVRSQFLMTSLLDNPAAAGNSTCLGMRMGVRSQWTGMDGAPVNQFASISSRIGDGEGGVQGFGAYVLTDAIGPWSNTRLNVAYSARVRMSSGSRLSAGIGFGMTQFKLDKINLNLPSGGVANDDALSDVDETQVVFPSLDAGLWFENRRTFASLSMLNLATSTLTDITGSSRPAGVIVISGGRYVPLDERYSFKPSVQIRKSGGLPASMDFRGTFSMNNQVSLGLGYRTRAALVGVINFQLFESVAVGYAYDFGVSSLNPAARNSHEIVLSISACDKNDPFFGSLGRCPAYE